MDRNRPVDCEYRRRTWMNNLVLCISASFAGHSRPEVILIAVLAFDGSDKCSHSDRSVHSASLTRCTTSSGTIYLSPSPISKEKSYRTEAKVPWDQIMKHFPYLCCLTFCRLHFHKISICTMAGEGC